MAITNGFLDITDPRNPTRPNRFRDDFLLRGITSGPVTVNLTSPYPPFVDPNRRIDPYLQIINADTGEVVDFDDDGGPGFDYNSRLTFTAQQGVNYVIRATSYGVGDIGRYTLTTNVGSIGLGGTPITGDQTFNGTLVTTDPRNPTRPNRFRDDYFLTGVAAGQTVTIDLTSPYPPFVDPNNRIDPYLQLIDADTGAVIQSDDDGGPGFDYNSQLSFTVAANTDYVIRATSFGWNDIGNYTLSTSTSSFSVNGTLADTDPSNPTRSSRFRDDYFLTGLNPGQSVQLNLNGNFDTFLQLIDADTGQVIRWDDDSGPGLNSQLTFTAQQGVDYIVRTTSFGSGVTGNYSLTSTVGVLYEGLPISPGPNEIIVGTLDNTDLNNDLRNGRFYDGYYLDLDDLVPGTPVQINLDTATVSSNGSFDTYLQLVNGSTGDLIAYNDDGGLGLNSRLTFTPQLGVEYIARVTSYGLGETGDYVLTFG